MIASYINGYLCLTPERCFRQNKGQNPEPMSLANMGANGTGSVHVECSACHHEATLNLDHLDSSVPVPDVPLVMRLKCSKCGAGAEQIFSRPNWAEQPAGPGGLRPYPGSSSG